MKNVFNSNEKSLSSNFWVCYSCTLKPWGGETRPRLKISAMIAATAAAATVGAILVIGPPGAAAAGPGYALAASDSRSTQGSRR